MSSSDSSDDENLQNLKEAADNQFINDSMFKKNVEKVNIDKVQNELLPSLRPNRNEFDDKMNSFRVTPAFQKHVSQKLQTLLDKSIEYEEKPAVLSKKRKKIKSEIKLLKTSQVFLEESQENITEVSNAPPPKIRKPKHICSSITENDLKSVAVSPEYILNKEECKNWSNRSKAKIFCYKKNKNGLLEEIVKPFS